MFAPSTSRIGKKKPDRPKWWTLTILKMIGPENGKVLANIQGNHKANQKCSIKQKRSERKRKIGIELWKRVDRVVASIGKASIGSNWIESKKNKASAHSIMSPSFKCRSHTFEHKQRDLLLTARSSPAQSLTSVSRASETFGSCFRQVLLLVLVLSDSRWRWPRQVKAIVERQDKKGSGRDEKQAIARQLLWRQIRCRGSTLTADSIEHTSLIPPACCHSHPTRFFAANRQTLFSYLSYSVLSSNRPV